VILGKDPKTSMDILLLKGPYGHYVQIGQTIKDAKEKPKRAAWTKGVPVPTEASADALALALKLLSLPRQLGPHPETGKPVEANIGRFGPYVKHDGMFKSIPKADNVHEIGLERAVQLLAEKKAAGGGGRSLGAHPGDKKTVAVYSGRYGPYVKHGKTNATIPSSIDPATLTLEQALELLEAKAAKTGGGKVRARAAGKTAAAPAAAPAARKTASAKPKAKSPARKKPGTGARKAPAKKSA
jgi:DNA topoisomerase-1